MASLSQPPVTVATASVAGDGRLGRVLARALRTAGVEVYGPTRRGEPVAAADVVLLCVPDAEIAGAAAALPHTGALIGHPSGATRIEGTGVDFGLHPLQTFVGDEPPQVFHDIGFAIAGRTPAALETARELATRLGGHPFPIEDDQRAAYHAAASIASNYTVTVLAAAERLAHVAGIPASDARALLSPLVRRTVDNWAGLGPAAALTGPVVRGDHATVQRQRDAVTAGAPDLLALFDALTMGTRALAVRGCDT